MSGTSLVDFFSSGRGQLVLGLVGLALGLVPLVKHYLITPKRVVYRVLYNSRIGISADDSTRQIRLSGGLSTADRQALQVIRLLDRMSIVVIRIENRSSFPIVPTDFVEPLSFTFGKRIVWNARISEASDRVREVVSDNMDFFGAATGPGQPQVVSRESATVREARLPQLILGLLRPQQPVASPAEPPEVEPSHHGVQLNKVDLKRREKFKLVVVLHEPVEDDAAAPDQVAIDKKVVQRGHLSNGEIIDEKKQSRVTLPRVAGGLAVVLFVAVIASLLVGPPTRDPSIRCAPGPLRLAGSSVFMPVVEPVAAQYSAACDDGPAITTDATGSKKGMLELVEPAGAAPKPEELAVVHDGPYPAGSDLEAHPIAVAIYSIAVNESVSARGVKGLSTGDLRRIWSGEVRYWDDLTGRTPPGAAGLPIRIVSRGAESGSRGIFEDRVLGTAEGGLTSDDCENRKTGVPGTSAVRCERDDNGTAIAEISTTPGAIGYVDIPPTNPQRKSRSVVPVQLDDVYPDISNIQPDQDEGYQFWTIEHVYTRGEPAAGTRLANFLAYLTGRAGSTLIQAAGYIPCVNPDGSHHQLCQ
ncbi:PstS family phosphate ABC transporter substrate-binding protein [Saccharothrix syringae]|uniref:Phosphate-binding protein n=1 Tax=Saccharothrix syringae TaxID=103733 RepID=A0A5Q0GZ04_SACSY|nr:substrate-binding domain-containing protein [Saccharothrix syringae]QFZ19251.1 phosphate-binding protein [Saccharothrix syringae]